jgi:hypothetical protein
MKMLRFQWFQSMKWEAVLSIQHAKIAYEYLIMNINSIFGDFLLLPVEEVCFADAAHKTLNTGYRQWTRRGSRGMSAQHADRAPVRDNLDS